MQVGVCTISSKTRSIEDVIDLVGGLNADGIEVWGQDHVGTGSPERCRQIKEAAHTHGLEIPVYGSYLRAGTDSFDDEMEREVRIATELDADLIRVWAGEEEYQDVSESHLAAVTDDLSELAQAAADVDLEVTVERHAGTVTNTTEGAESLIENTPDAVGLNWQPSFGQSSTDIAADIDALASITNNVHVQALAAVNGDERCPLAYAYFDIEDIVHTLDAAGFDGYLEIEFVTDRSPYHPALASDVAFLSALVSDLD